eukprot:5007508-Heterocapsa_arctica.AAC.1
MNGVDNDFVYKDVVVKTRFAPERHRTRVQRRDLRYNRNNRITGHSKVTDTVGIAINGGAIVFRDGFKVIPFYK